MQPKKLFGDALFVQGINFLIKAVWILVIDRGVQNTLENNADYGSYFSILSFSILFVILLDFGINSFNTREIANDTGFIKSSLGSMFLAKLMLTGVFLVVLFAAAFILGYPQELLWLLGAIAIFQVLTSLNQFMRSTLAGLHEYRKDGFLASFDRMIVVLVCGAMLYFPALRVYLNISSFVAAQLLGAVIVTGIGFLLIRKHIATTSWTFRTNQVLRILKQALPFALLAALMAFYTRLDAVMISFMLNDVEASRYAMSYRLLDAGNMVAVLLSGMLLPLFTKNLKESGVIQNLSRTAFFALVVPGLMVVFVCSMHALWLLETLYPNKADLAEPFTLVALLFAFVPISSIYIFGTLLTASKDLSFLNILAAVCALSNLILNYFLIPVYEIQGAAIATLITQGVFAILCFLRSREKHHFTMGFFSILIHTFLIASVLAIIYWSKQFFISPLVHIVFSVTIVVVYAVGYQYFTRNKWTLNGMS
jgi:O-antigen/teichoic acid export membrane protein